MNWTTILLHISRVDGCVWVDVRKHQEQTEHREQSLGPALLEGCVAAAQEGEYIRPAVCRMRAQRMVLQQHPRIFVVFVGLEEVGCATGGRLGGRHGGAALSLTSDKNEIREKIEQIGYLSIYYPRQQAFGRMGSAARCGDKD